MGTGRVDSLPARPTATGPVTATAPVADVQQGQAKGPEAFRVGWHLYLMDLLSLTSCRAIWARRTTSRAQQVAEPLVRARRDGFDQSRAGFATVGSFPGKIAVRRALEQTATPVTGKRRSVRHGCGRSASRGAEGCGAASVPSSERRPTFRNKSGLGASQQAGTPKAIARWPPSDSSWQHSLSSFLRTLEMPC